jgi:alkylation response protein AidB-like acyl-CoA dehydrogenase
MNFELTDEQRMLQEMLGDFARSRYGFEARRAASETADGFSREVWRELAELGVLGIPFAEADGGLGGGGVETMIAMEAIGQALMLEPFLATIVLAGAVLREGSAEQRAARIPAIVAGQHLMSLAHYERGGARHRFDQVGTRAARAEGGWRIDGAKTAVLAGAAADELIISADTGDGVSLFLVSESDGLTVMPRKGYDGAPLAEIALDGVQVGDSARVGEVGSGASILGRAFEEATAAVCAEAVGVMSDMLATTTDYLKTRTQFGVAIGSFQALQHRAVDMLMEVELARSMAMLAALSLSLPARDRALNISAAKARIGRAGRFVGQQAVQLHGAIGLTEEYKVGHGFRRLTAIDALFGDADHHADRIARAGGLPPII